MILLRIRTCPNHRRPKSNTPGGCIITTRTAHLHRPAGSVAPNGHVPWEPALRNASYTRICTSDCAFSSSNSVAFLALGSENAAPRLRSVAGLKHRSAGSQVDFLAVWLGFAAPRFDPAHPARVQFGSQAPKMIALRDPEASTHISNCEHRGRPNLQRCRWVPCPCPGRV